MHDASITKSASPLLRLYVFFPNPEDPTSSAVFIEHLSALSTPAAMQPLKISPEGVARKWRYFLLISNISLSHAYLTGTSFLLYSTLLQADISLRLKDLPVLFQLTRATQPTLKISTSQGYRPLAPANALDLFLS